MPRYPSCWAVLIGFVAEPTIAGLFVREPTVAGGLVADPLRALWSENADTDRIQRKADLL